MSVKAKDKHAAIIAAAIIYNRKVDNYMKVGQAPPVGELARDAAAEAAVIVYAIEKHMAPRERR